MQVTDSNHPLLNKTGVRRVQFYVAPGQVETCDRCSAAIRNVALVTYKDSTVSKFGSECIKKILAQAPSLRTLFTKNAKLLKEYTDALEVLSRDPHDMPRGSEYFQSGLYFIADSTGKDIHGPGRSYFHPLIDEAKNSDPERIAAIRNNPHSYGGVYLVEDTDKFYAEKLADINGSRGKTWFAGEINRLERFLAAVLNKIQ
jgi:hypothetical protein